MLVQRFIDRSPQRFSLTQHVARNDHYYSRIAIVLQFVWDDGRVLF